MFRTQSDSTKKLGERLHDIGFWKYELQREIEDMLAETDMLLAQQVYSWLQGEVFLSLPSIYILEFKKFLKLAKGI